MTASVAIYAASFNPPGRHHRAVAEALCREFDAVVIVPESPRPERPADDDVAPMHRAALADIAFRGLPSLRVDLVELEQASRFTPMQLAGRFGRDGEAWYVVTAAQLRGGAGGHAEIQSRWTDGPALWGELRFAVLYRPDEAPEGADLPPHARLVAAPVEGSSRAIREHLFRHQPVDGLVDRDVAEYIERYGLYRGRPPARVAPIRLNPPRPEWVVDERNPHAVSLAKELGGRLEGGPPNCIAVAGGDGTMLHAIRQHWRRRLPFVGINAGHRGFLLNGAEAFAAGWPVEPLLVRPAPLLYVEVQPPDDGPPQAVHAFNDAWVERRSSQAAWIEVRVGGEARIAHLVGDGVLLATAAGSTAYARAMGATPVLFDTPAVVLVGSNVLEPPHWKSVMLGLDSSVEFRNLDPGRRPLAAFADGVPLGEAAWMRVRISRTASAELVFTRRHDMAEKISQLQFPPR